MSIKTAVNQRVLQRMLDWGESVIEFKEGHALDGLFVAEGWCRGSISITEEDLFLLGLNIAFNFWIDDRSDEHLNRETPVLDWGALLEFAETGVHPPKETTPEIDALARLSHLLATRAKHPEEHDFWQLGAARTLRTMYSEEQFARGARSPTFAECLELGSYSTGIEMILMGAYLVHNVNRPVRSADAWLPNAERYMCIYQRLLNDLCSAEKERHEGGIGRRSNAVLLMEEITTPAEARRFVERQAEAYRRLTDDSLDRLKGGDACVQLIRCLRSQIDRWYEQNPARYSL